MPPAAATALTLAVFDMAGTTIRDSGQVPAAFATVLARHGVTVDDAALVAVRGASKREAIHTLLAQTFPRAPDLETRTDRAYADFQAHLADVFSRGGVQAIEGAADTFKTLRARGIKVALNTGFDREMAMLILNAVGWASGTVDAIVCGEDVPAGRPAPYLIHRSMELTGTLDVRSVAATGDTTLDLEAGHNAGCGLVVGVLSGAHDRARLATRPHHHLIPSVAAFPALLD
ncbi:MAG: phosphonatase-like hydrolase [Burkholderiales bacterium]